MTLTSMMKFLVFQLIRQDDNTAKPANKMKPEKMNKMKRNNIRFWMMIILSMNSDGDVWRDDSFIRFSLLQKMQNANLVRAHLFVNENT